MPALLTEILIILLLLVTNGVFAMSEMALVAARKSRLEQLANEGDAKARAALQLANAPSDFLSTVQVGITLIGILAGAFGGATLAETLALWLAPLPIIGPYSEAIGIGVVVLCLTYLSLIVGELVPKRLALSQPERIAAAMAGPLSWLSRLASPVVRLLSASTEAVTRLMGLRAAAEAPVTEEEIKVLLEQGTAAGVFVEAEQDLVERVLTLADQRVGAVMTPRMDIVWLDIDDPPDVLQRKIADSAHSRFPVARGNLENVVGVVHAKDLLAQSLSGTPLNVSVAMDSPVFVLNTTSTLKLLERLKQARTHLAFVVNEYGGIQGMVTLSDVAEAVIGVSSLEGIADPPAVQRADGSWLLDGRLSIEDFKIVLDLADLPGEESGYYQTLGGFVMTHLSHVPAAGDQFEWGGWRFEVMDMDALRVDKVLARKLETE
jgi:putative hemolysin